MLYKCLVSFFCLGFFFDLFLMDRPQEPNAFSKEYVGDLRSIITMVPAQVERKAEKLDGILREKYILKYSNEDYFISIYFSNIPIIKKTIFRNIPIINQEQDSLDGLSEYKSDYYGTVYFYEKSSENDSLPERHVFENTSLAQEGFALLKNRYYRNLIQELLKGKKALIQKAQEKDVRGKILTKYNLEYDDRETISISLFFSKSPRIAHKSSSNNESPEKEEKRSKKRVIRKFSYYGRLVYFKRPYTEQSDLMQSCVFDDDKLAKVGFKMLAKRYRRFKKE